MDLERVGPAFSSARLMEAREKTWRAMNELAALIRPGMLEEEAYELAKSMFAQHGAPKAWHRPHVRFGINTLKAYSEPSQPGVRLGEKDLFFLDVGPIWNGYEGDAGDTYVVGDDPEMLRCAKDAREIFAEVRAHWLQSKVNGPDLYRFAELRAQSRGWVLNTRVNGHRVSDFPHALHFKGSLTDQEAIPQPGLWVLEIQIRHPEREIGAFFEDLLI